MFPPNQADGAAWRRLGEGAHALNESMLLEQFPVRTALLAKLLQNL